MSRPRTGENNADSRPAALQGPSALSTGRFSSPSPAALSICYRTLGQIQGSSCARVRDTEGLELGGAQQFGEFRGPESQGELRIHFSQPEKPGKEEVGQRCGSGWRVALEDFCPPTLGEHSPICCGLDFGGPPPPETEFEETVEDWVGESAVTQGI